MDNLADHIAGGGCEEWGAYKYAVGMMEAYARAESELLELDQRLTEN